MLLEIHHLTQYRYSAMVRESVMELWVQPQKGAGQRLLSFDIELEPVAQLFSYADSFGNPVYHFDCPQPHDRLTIRSRAVVETEPDEALPEALDMGEWDRLRSEFVRGDCFDLLRPHGFAVATPMLEHFIKSHDLDRLRHADPLTAVKGVCQSIYDAFEYEQGVTRADSPIDHMLGAGCGVCQDFAHVMLAICRAWGLPARYVSGYLLTDREHHDRSDPAATHAWVEVFLPSLRWVGFDPTNNTAAGERHVIVAVGRDYGDVPPSRGVFKGDAESELAVRVSVRPTRAAVAEPEFLRTTTGRPVMVGATRRRQSAGALDQQLQQQQQQQ
jgi:transglutaminase-like putative cysteine protease